MFAICCTLSNVIRASIPLMELALTKCEGQTNHGVGLDDFLHRHYVVEESAMSSWCWKTSIQGSEHLQPRGLHPPT